MTVHLPVLYVLLWYFVNTRVGVKELHCSKQFSPSKNFILLGLWALLWF